MSNIPIAAADALKCSTVVEQEHRYEPLVRIVWCGRVAGHRGAHRFNRNEVILTKDTREPVE